MASPTKTDAEVAVEAARAGALQVRERYGASLTRHAKSAVDFATDADLASERAIGAVLAEHRPGDALVGEEFGRSGADASRTWLVDPLCGTLNFAAQTPLFSVNVALLDGGTPLAAAAVDPIADEVFWTDGQGAWLGVGETVQALRPSADSLLVDVNVDAVERVAGVFDGTQLLGDPAFLAAFGPRVVSTTLALTWVAAGRRAGYVTAGDFDGSVHFAAGLALCQAAGCVVTALDGSPLHTAARGLVAAADQATHQRLVDLVRPHLQP